jgi:hypothetical protein
MMDTNTEKKLVVALVYSKTFGFTMQIVADQMITDHRNNADLDEVLEFIEDMQVTDEDVVQ